MLDLLRSRVFVAVALIAALAFGFANPERFLSAYLYAFLFWVGVPIGSLCLLMIQYQTGGRWGMTIRRILEASTRTLPVMALLLLPILFGLRHLYSWARLDSISEASLRHVIEHKRLYLNPAFFTVRAVFYFAVWYALSFFLNQWSVRLESGRDLRLERRVRSLSGGGLVLMGLTITFASIDWAMSLDPRWQSTIYGILFMVGNVLSAFSIAILVVTAQTRPDSKTAALDRETSHDLGKLLLAFTMLWAYVHLSQFLIVWSANLPEEIPWYLRRMSGAWGALAVAVGILQFILPFPMLLSRDLKRTPALLARVAGLILLGRLCDLFWVVGPAFSPPISGPHILDALALAAIGGIWVSLFTRQLARRPLLIPSDASLENAHSA